jgi:hypothetical protein
MEGETHVPGENHPPVASYLQTLSHKVVSSSPRHERRSLGVKFYVLPSKKGTLVSKNVLESWTILVLFPC